MPIPIAATAQIVAAVVIPFMRFSPRKITPAPKNPMPVTMLEAILSGLLPKPMYRDIIVKKQEPTEIIIIVRKPADLLRYSLSAPTSPPQSTANKKRMIISNDINFVEKFFRYVLSGKALPNLRK